MVTPTTSRADDLGDDHRREYPQAYKLLEQSLVGQHLGDDAETGQGQDAGEAEGLGEFEIEGEIDAEEVRRDQHRDDDGDDDRHGPGDEETAAHRRHETGNVDFLEADQEEKDEDSDAEEELDFARRFDDSGYRAKQDTSHGVGDDGDQADAAGDPRRVWPRRRASRCGAGLRESYRRTSGSSQVKGDGAISAQPGRDQK